MPVLHVTTNAALEASQRDVLARALTQLAAQILHKRPDVTVVTFDARPQAAWYIGGVPAAACGVLLEIDITEGSNLAQEKALFIEHAYALLGQHLGHGVAIAEASYVVVRENPASDWGYRGITQARRREPQGPG
jgi:4-oxalocrotonate tautomerase